jgi:hypothetical protein
MNRTTTRLLAVLLATGLALGGAACGGDDGSSTPAEPTATETTGASSEDDASSESATAPEDSDLGWRISGEPGSVVEVTSLTRYAGQDQQPLDQTFTLTDEPRLLLFTVFIESAEVEVVVTEGGPVLVEGFWGHLADPDNPFGEIVVDEVLASAEASVDSPATIAIP